MSRIIQQKETNNSLNFAKKIFFNNFNFLILILIPLILVPGFIFFIQPKYISWQETKEYNLKTVTDKKEELEKYKEKLAQKINEYEAMDVGEKEKVHALIPSNFSYEDLFTRFEKLIEGSHYQLNSIKIEDVTVKKGAEAIKPIAGTETSEKKEDANLGKVDVSLDFYGPDYAELKEFMSYIEETLPLMNILEFSWEKADSKDVESEKSKAFLKIETYYLIDKQ